jgi:hypothetical protein
MDEKLYEIIEKEREKSDKSYAIKLVEKIVFGLVSMILIAAVAEIIHLIFKSQ